MSTKFEKVENRQCHGPYSYYKTIEEAKLGCSKDIECTAIYSYACMDEGFNLCKNGTDSSSSITGSCVYRQKGKCYLNVM